MLTSARGRSILVAACVVLTFVALIVSSFSIRVFLAALVLLGAAIWAAITLLHRRQETNTSSQKQDLTNSPESFAVSSLFEATMGSMREGLLVEIGRASCRERV